jgi:hypothetical protein
MIVGNPSKFALESVITRAYDSLHFLALGCFLIHIQGRKYGVDSPTATMMGNSFEEVGDRIARRGMHNAPVAEEPDAFAVADAFRRAVYLDLEENGPYLGYTQDAFTTMIYTNHAVWAPDGDEAFDDSSYVLHCDVDDRVRLIAFQAIGPDSFDAHSLRELWLSGDEFYDVLQEWHDSFAAAWAATPKSSESEPA